MKIPPSINESQFEYSTNSKIFHNRNIERFQVPKESILIKNKSTLSQLLSISNVSFPALWCQDNLCYLVFFCFFHDIFATIVKGNRAKRNMLSSIFKFLDIWNNGILAILLKMMEI